LIYVTEDQLQQVEYLIAQSINGNHVLFDSEILKKVLRTETPFREEDAYSVEHHLERILCKPDIQQKRAYLEGLDSQTHEQIIRTYFSIVENNLFENLKVTH